MLPAFSFARKVAPETKARRIAPARVNSFTFNTERYCADEGNQIFSLLVKNTTG